MDAINEIIKGAGGGAAISLLAWTLLFKLWQRFEKVNQARVDELTRRADICEEDRKELRKEVGELHSRFHEFEHSERERVTDAIEDNTKALDRMSEHCVIEPRQEN